MLQQKANPMQTTNYGHIEYTYLGKHSVIKLVCKAKGSLKYRDYALKNDWHFSAYNVSIRLAVLSTSLAKIFPKYFEKLPLPMQYRELARPKIRLFTVLSLVTTAKCLDNVPSDYPGILNENEFTIHGELLVL